MFLVVEMYFHKYIIHLFFQTFRNRTKIYLCEVSLKYVYYTIFLLYILEKTCRFGGWWQRQTGLSPQLFITDSSKAVLRLWFTLIEPQHDKTTKMACAPSEDLDQSGHPHSLIRVFLYAQWVAKDPRFLPSSYGWRRLWSDWAGCPGWSESSLGAQAILLV